MSQLRVRFAGLFLLARHRAQGQDSGPRDRLTMLAVDARNPEGRAGAWMNQHGHEHLDGTPITPHAGYANISLKYLAAPNAWTNPVDNAEMVFRLDRSEITFGGLAATGSVDIEGAAEGSATVPFLADFDAFSDLKVDAGCLDRTPADPVLARLELGGGCLRPDVRRVGEWDIPGDRLPNGRPLRQRGLAGVAEWVVPLGGPEVTLKIESFDRGTLAEFSLRPQDGEILLELGNLCADNPLQWPELGTSAPHDEVRDVDFKWFYFLMEDPESIRQGLAGQELPVPEQTKGGAGIWWPCMLGAASTR